MPSSTRRRNRSSSGGSEYVFSKEYLGIYWPADEFIFVELTAKGKFDAFYAEAGKLLAETVSAKAVGPADGHHRRGDPAQPRAGPPAVRQGQSEVRLRYDLLDYWHKVRGGEQALAAARSRWRSRSTAPASPTTTSRSGAARSSGGATRRAPISTRRGRPRSRPSSPATTEPCATGRSARPACRFPRSASAPGASAGAPSSRPPTATPTTHVAGGPRPRAGARHHFLRHLRRLWQRP